MERTTEDSWMLEAPVSNAIWHMALPMMLGMSVNMIYNITDTFFIGKLEDTAALAAIALLLPFTTVLMAIGNLFGTGGSTLFSRLLGRGDDEKARRCSAVTLWSAIVCGALCILISTSFTDDIARLLGADAATRPCVEQYLRSYGAGAPFIILNFTLEQLIRGEGGAVQSMIGMMISVCVNIILDPVLMFGADMGIGGAAIATVLGNMAAVVYYIVCIQRAGKQLTADPRYVTLERAMLKEILTVGISAMLLDILLVVSSLIFNFYAMKYGDYVLAGFGISQKLVQIVDLVGMGLYMGVIPLIAVAYGAGDCARVDEIVRKTALYLALLTAGLVLALFLFRGRVMTCFSRDADVIRMGGFILSVQLCSSFFAAGAGLLTGIFQAEGRGGPAVLMSAARGAVLIPATVIGDKLFGVNGVIFSLLAAEAISCLAGSAAYRAYGRN